MDGVQNVSLFMRKERFAIGKILFLQAGNFRPNDWWRGEDSILSFCIGFIQGLPKSARLHLFRLACQGLFALLVQHSVINCQI
jgi:hypothetical protein